ncbi:MAG: hypothetical protein R6X32_05775 [Chloroflexota bacterium]
MWTKLLKLRFKLLMVLVVIIATGAATIAYIKKERAILTTGICPTSAPQTSQTIIRESDQTSWCLSGLSEPVIQWQWSPDGSLFAYALQDKDNPTRQLSGRWGYVEVTNLNWYVMNHNGSRHKSFSAPNPAWFTFSPDGQYAVYITYNDYGRTKQEIVKISNESLVCRYEQYNLWYSAGNPSCDGIKLKTGAIWNIEKEVNKSACTFHVTSWGWSNMLDERGCRLLLKDTDLVPTITPIPTAIPIPTAPSMSTAYPEPADRDEPISPYP